MKNKKKIVIISIMLLVILTILIGLNKKEIKLDEVKLKNTLSYDSKNLSIMIYNNTSNEYEKYTGEGFPDRTQYVYNTTDSGCLNTNGDKIANALNYDTINRKVTVTTRETVHCYMYFSSGKTLTLEKGEGIDKIYYKVNEDTEYSESNTTVSVAVLPGNTYSYYAEASEGYTMASCYDDNEHLCSGTMSNENQTIEVNNTTPNKYTLTIPYSVGVKEIKYKINGSSEWSTQTINATADGNTTISNVDYNSTYEYYATKTNNFVTLNNCYDENTNKCSGTMNNINGVTATKINTTFITLANYVISISNNAGSNGVITQSQPTTTQTGSNATTDYRYIGNDLCSYENGNYIVPKKNKICQTLYNYTETNKESGNKKYYTYSVSCPSWSPSYTYSCTTLEGTEISKGPENYVCLGNLQSNGQCEDDEHLYRIIGVIPTQTTKSGAYENRIKLIKSEVYMDDNAVDNAAYYWSVTGWDSNYSGYTGINKVNYNNWEESTLNRVVLNQTFYNSLDKKYQNMIGNSVWYLGGGNTSLLSSSSMYTVERSNNVCSKYGVNPTYAERKIGLIYPSDYLYATSGGSTTNRATCLTTNLYSWNGSGVTDCRNNDWLLSNSSGWSITPNNIEYHYVYYIASAVSGLVKESGTVYSTTSLVYPVFYLTSETRVLSGTGSINSPYTLGS